MRIKQLHTWDLTPREAVALQRQLADRVDAHTPLGECELVAGTDVSYAKFSNVFFGGVVVYRLSDGVIVEKQGAVHENPFPYVPGLLSFREAPAVLDAFRKLRTRPDAVIVDGHGYAHPRRFGIACHLGYWLQLPTIGCAKSLLVGDYHEPGSERGCHRRLTHKGELIGQVLRTKTGVKPVFVSVGHKIDLPSAARLVLRCCRGYRLPEPTRQTHLHVNALRCGVAC